MSSHCRGNILFLILLAVVLFAALSYAVTNSLGGGGKDMSDENARAGGAAISQYVTLLRNEVQRLMLMNDCQAVNLDWRDDYWKRYNGGYTYTIYSGPPPSPKAGCAIFTAYGGNVTPQDFEKYSIPKFNETQAGGSAIKGGHAFIRWVNRKFELTPKNDVGIIFNGMDIRLCQSLLGLPYTTSLSAEDYDKNTDANSPEPATFTTSTRMIDTATNMVTDFFATIGTSSFGVDYCQLGTVILAQ